MRVALSILNAIMCKILCFFLLGLAGVHRRLSYLEDGEKKFIFGFNYRVLGNEEVLVIDPKVVKKNCLRSL